MNSAVRYIPQERFPQNGGKYSNSLSDDREIQKRYLSENEPNNICNSTLQKPNRFSVSKISEKSFAFQNERSKTFDHSELSVPPIIVSSHDDTIFDDMDADSGKEHDSCSPLIPRPAIRLSRSDAFHDDAHEELNSNNPDCPIQRKRPSIQFAIDVEDNTGKESYENKLKSRNASVCSNMIPEEMYLYDDYPIIIIDRKNSEISNSSCEGEPTNPSSDTLHLSANIPPSFFNFGDGDKPLIPSKDILSRRASIQLAKTSHDDGSTENLTWHHPNSITLPMDYDIKSSRILRSYLNDIESENFHKRQCSIDLPYSALQSHRHSIFTQSKITLPDVAKRGQIFAQRRKERLVDKQGEFNISYKNIRQKSVSYLADIFTTVLDMKWRYTILLFIVTFCFSWFMFALCWLLIVKYGGRTSYTNESVCITDVDDFASALLFSIETQHTIGYGVRVITAKCQSAIALLMIQSLFGVIVQCVMAGFVLAKLARPKYRAETIMFSKNAVITQEDGEFCLIFRVGDMRRSQLVGAVLHAMFIKKRKTQEGDEIPFYQYHLEVAAESEDYDQFIFLSWPIRVIHKINRLSPLWNVSADKLLAEDFEIIVVLEGVVEATGMTTQVRTSYLPSEIMWGHRLKPLLTYRRDNGRFEIDYGCFNEVEPVEMKEVCAADLHGSQNLDSISKEKAPSTSLRNIL